MQKEQISNWHNQQLITYHDSYFTGSVFELSMSASSTESYFNPPKLNIAIHNRIIRRVFAFDFVLIMELLKKAKTFIESYKRRDVSSEIKFINHKHVTIYFQITKEMNIQCTIESSKTDVISVTLSPNVFLSMLELFKSFKDNYLSLSTTIHNRDILSKISESVDSLRNEFKNLNFQINKFFDTKYSEINNKVIKKEIDYENIIEKNSCSSFEHDSIESGQDQHFDIEDIPINGIDNSINDEIMQLADSVDLDLNINNDKKKPSDSEMFLIPKMFGDISKFESYWEASDNKFFVKDFIDFLNSQVISPNYSPLDGLSENWIKNINLLSSVYYLKIIKTYMTQKGKVNDRIPFYDLPINKESTTIENVNLAYELLIISGYLRIMKSMLSKRVTDDYENYTLKYVKYRLMTDPFIIPFIKDLDHKLIVDNISKKFKIMKDNGFFKPYEKVMDLHGCKAISEKQMEVFADEFVSKGFSAIISFEKLWPMVLTIKYETPIEFEDINEIVQVELELIPGENPNRELIIQKNPEISEKVLNYYISDKLTQPIKKEKRTKRKAIVKYIDFILPNINEPAVDDVKEFRDKLHEAIQENPNLNIDDTIFSLNALPDEIQIAVDIWNSLDNKNIKFNNFYELVEQEKLKNDKVLTENIETDFDDISSLSLL